MKKRLMIVSVIAVVLLAGVLAVKAATSSSRSFKIANGTVVQGLTSRTDKTIKVRSGGKNYQVYLKNFSSNGARATFKECTKSNFTHCTKKSATKIVKNDKIKITGVYYKKSKRYAANKVLFYTPPTSGYGY